MTTRIILIMTFALSVAASVLAQKQSASTATSTTTAATATTATASTAAAPAQTATAGDEDSAENRRSTRREFTLLVAQHPKSVARVLSADPALLADDSFLARYPDLMQFVGGHPEVRRNPDYYTREIEVPSDISYRRTSLDDAVEGFTIMLSLGLVATALAWVVRTIIDQRRWNHLARRQSEVHNKILDRFSSSEEVLAYIKSPAGARFLESAPIPVHSEPARPNPPQSRAMWSIQIGIIVAAGAVGAILVSYRLDPDASRALFAMGAIALCVGLGFIGSAAVSVYVSRRLGITNEMDDPAGVR